MLFPIRGKLINAFNCTRERFFSNEEVQGITMIVFGQEYRKGFTIDDVKVSKIIIMADGDVDRQYCPKMLFAKPCGLFI